MRSFIAKTSVPLFATCLIALSGCAAQEQDAAENPALAVDSTAESKPEAESFDPAQMPAMSLTGWRVLGEDGAVYTTYFDADGSYRDFKNGEELQSGTWDERNDGQLCFTPAVEHRIGECWKLGMVGSDKIMTPVSDAGKTIELRQVTYIAPVEEE